MESTSICGRHVEDEDFETYVLGTMSETQISLLEEHLLICELCRNRLEGTEAFLSAIYHAGRQIRSTSQTTRPWIMALSAAAVVVLATFLIGVPVHVGRQEARLYAMRGAVGAKITARQPLLLKLDLTGLPVFPSYRLQIVDTSGKPVFKGAVTVEDPEFKLDGIPSGLYFVRLSSPGGELLREYGLSSERQ